MGFAAVHTEGLSLRDLKGGTSKTTVEAVDFTTRAPHSQEMVRTNIQNT